MESEMVPDSEHRPYRVPIVPRRCRRKAVCRMRLVRRQSAVVVSRSAVVARKRKRAGRPRAIPDDGAGRGMAGEWGVLRIGDSPPRRNATEAACLEAVHHRHDPLPSTVFD